MALKCTQNTNLTFLDALFNWETLIQTRCFKSYNLVAAQPPQVAAYNWDLVPEIGIETATLQFEIIIAINISNTLKASISFLFLSNKTCTSSLFALLEETLPKAQRIRGLSSSCRSHIGSSNTNLD